jgi:hypothetical protein
MIFPNYGPLQGGTLPDYQASLVSSEISELANEDCPLLNNKTLINIY